MNNSKAHCYETIMLPAGHFTCLWRSASAQTGALQLIKIRWLRVLLIIDRVGACWREGLNQDDPVECWCALRDDLKVLLKWERWLSLTNLSRKTDIDICVAPYVLPVRVRKQKYRLLVKKVECFQKVHTVINSLCGRHFGHRPLSGTESLDKRGIVL